MKRWKVWVSVLVIFVAGFVAGTVVTRITVRRFVQHAIHDPDLMRQRIERRLASTLRLDDAQREKVHLILLEAQDELKGLRREFQPQFIGIMTQAETQISATLTPEQRERFRRFQEQSRPWWQPR